jgi:polyisoprenoid-binding protein YceI
MKERFNSRLNYSRMKRTVVSVVALATLLWAGAGQVWSQSAEVWQIDPVHSNASFAVDHMGISEVRGEFTKVSGSAKFDGKHLDGAQVEAVIDTTTINTREPRRDADLKSERFLDVAKFPSMTFKSKQFRQRGNGHYTIVGDLTLHGVTKQVVLDGRGPSQPIKDMQGNWRLGTHATTTIDRRDYGLVWNKTLESGGVLVGNEVRITLDAELVKAGH